jgi:tetratricopeptide (TPR) repeat protein
MGSGPYATAIVLAMTMILPLRVRAQQKPFTQEQVSNMVRAGLGDESGAKLIEQRGIDFNPTKVFMQNLKSEGASDIFLKAIHAAKSHEDTSAKKPISQIQIFALLAGQVPSHRVAVLVGERDIDFEPQDDYFQEVRLGGGDDELIDALKSAKVVKASIVDPAEQARQLEVRKHMARGAEYGGKGQYAQAEQEYRGALLLDSQNADLLVSLATALYQQKKYDDSAAACREALRLNPDHDLGHMVLGAALGGKSDWDDELTEEREALRLNPNDDAAHVNLGKALTGRGDLDGGIAEYREALRLNPRDETAHNDLAISLASKGDTDGAISEYREALRLNPNYMEAHVNLGTALGNKGDWDGEIAEQQAALRLNPGVAEAHYNLGAALASKGDIDSAIPEYREAARLNPNYAMPHSGLGLVLYNKGDMEGAIIEYREALRLNPKDAWTHNNFGAALERSGDLLGAMEEYRTAYTLDSTSSIYRQNYERLVRQGNQ